MRCMTWAIGYRSIKLSTGRGKRHTSWINCEYAARFASTNSHFLFQGKSYCSTPRQPHSVCDLPRRKCIPGLACRMRVPALSRHWNYPSSKCVVPFPFTLYLAPTLLCAPQLHNTSTVRNTNNDSTARCTVHTHEPNSLQTKCAYVVTGMWTCVVLSANSLRTVCCEPKFVAFSRKLKEKWVCQVSCVRLGFAEN